MKNKKTRTYIYTFLAVTLAIFIIGFIGVNISLKYIQNKYIELQIDVNKRQAEQMSKMVEGQIKMGIPLDEIKKQFQDLVVETANDKGFLCMYDTKEDQLVCHPDKNVIGTKFNKDFLFKYQNEGKEKLITDIYKQTKGAGGIFKQGNKRTDIIYTIPVKNSNWFINAHENIKAISDEISMLRTRYIIGAFILGLLIAISVTITARKISRSYEKEIEKKNKELDANYSELKILHSEIETQRDYLIVQRDEIAQKNEQITDSINYAFNIQAAVMPSVEILNNEIPNNFLIYKPKDIVSGDFYWFSNLKKQLVIVAADSTGHGVPGAFMSMLGITMLNEIIIKRHILQANLVLDELREQIKIALRQNGNPEGQSDGMDISICILNIENLNLQYAGAYNSLYIIRKTEEDSNFKLNEIKADRMPIGVHPNDNISFRNNQIRLLSKDRLYMFSDGYASQFGGENNEKFMSKRFKDLLSNIQGNNIFEQKEILLKTLSNWQGEQKQLDDILVIGLEI